MPTYQTLSVKQPWAELIASGRKTIEMRTWRTSYRGELLIAASSSPKSYELEGRRLPAGVTVCLVELTDIREFTIDDLPAAGYEGHELFKAQNLWKAELGMNLCGTTVYAWLLARPRRVEPVPLKGRLHIFPVDLPAPLKLTK